MRRMAPLLLLLAVSACENRDRLSDAEAATEALPPENALADAATESLSATPAPAPSSEDRLLYEAIGLDPQWRLSIRTGSMMLQGPSGSIVEATPPTFRSSEGTLSSGRLTVTISQGPCGDELAPHQWRDRVQVTVGGKQLEGCGGGLVDLGPVLPDSGSNAVEAEPQEVPIA